MESVTDAPTQTVTPTSPHSCVKADLPGSTALAALASIVCQNGLLVSVRGLRSLAGLGNLATDGVSMMYAAGKCGFDAVPLEGEFEQLPELVFPAIVTFRDETFQVLYEVEKSSATIGDTLTGEVRRLAREEFVARWTGDVFQVTRNAGLDTAKEALRRIESPTARLAAIAGLAPVSPPRILFVLATLAWLSLSAVARPVTLLTAGCLLASLWMAAYPRGCQRCGATSSLTGKLPIAPLGAAFYALLTAVGVYGSPLALSAGLLAATGAHLGLVSILLRKRIACYPCLATAMMAWTATALTVRTAGHEIWILPASLLGTLVVVHFAGKLARYETTSVMMTLAAQVMAEPLTFGPDKARLVIYTRANCPICAYFKAVIRPALEEEFGEALLLEERDADKLNMGVPVFFVTGTTRLALASVGTDEMLSKLGAAVQAALTPELGPLGNVGGMNLSGFDELFGTDAKIL